MDAEQDMSAGQDIPLVHVTPHVGRLEAVPFPTVGNQDDIMQTSPGERLFIGYIPGWTTME
jgi:hypothetical protein